MPTASEMITDALIECGVMTHGQTASPERLAYGLGRLNRLMGQWTAAPGWYIDGTDVNTYSVVGGTNEITIGPSGANITATVPAQILGANILEGENRTPLRLLSPEEWMSANPRYFSGGASELYYERDQPNGRIYLRGTPASTFTLELFTPERMQQFALLSDSLVAADGFHEAIVAVLTEALCPGLHVPVTAEIAEIARRGKQSLLRMASRSTPITSELATTTTFSFEQGRFI